MSEAANRRREATRAKIVEAARKLFGQLGYHNTQVMDIVHAVGMSAGTFYNHFKDKKDLFDQLSAENVENLRQQLKRLRDPLDTMDRERQGRMLRESFTAFFDFVDENPQQVLMLLRGHGGDEAGLDSWSVSRQFGEDLVVEAERWTSMGVRPVHDPIFFGHGVVGMSLQVLQSYLVERRFTREGAIDALVSMTLAMIDACFESEAEVPSS
jgi:AcrR family transcriptional regulator